VEGKRMSHRKQEAEMGRRRIHIELPFLFFLISAIVKTDTIISKYVFMDSQQPSCRQREGKYSASDRLTPSLFSSVHFSGT
jgi:hypothetical protein